MSSQNPTENTTRTETRSSDALINLDEWCDRYNLFQPIIPFQVRQYDPINALLGFREMIDNANPTNQRIRYEYRSGKRTGLEGHINCDITRNITTLQPLLELHGGWPAETHTRSAFNNPEYIHERHYSESTLATDEEQRLEIANRYVDTGWNKKEHLSRRFGISLKEVDQFLEQHQINWERRKSTGRHRLARTWKLLSEWGYTQQMIANAFGCDRTTIAHDINERAGGFYPPDDPTRDQIPHRN